MIVMQLVSDEPTQFVRSYTPHGFEGRGHLVLTCDVQQAQRYPNTMAAFHAYREISNTHPLRTDGRPNRPLTAFSIWFRPIEDFIPCQPV